MLSFQCSHPSNVGQPAELISRDHPCKHTTVGESNSRHSEVPIPRADLDVTGEGFVVTCSDEEVLKLVADSAKTAGQVVDMLGVNMSLG
jgi:hypothetical protein